MLSEDKKTKISQHIIKALPETKAIYLFGSMAIGDAKYDSDVDIAIWIDMKPTGDQAFEIKSEISLITKKDVDLIDLLRADLITKSQVISTGEILFAKSFDETAFFENYIYSRFVNFNEEIREIESDILKRGKIRD